MDHSKGDPADAIWEAVGGKENVNKITLFGEQLLVGTYLRPAKTGGGILLTEKIRDEDIYQGKVGLVLKLGSTAFKDREGIKFGGDKVKVGDWVFFSVQDGRAMSVMGHHCRRIEDVFIGGILPDPDVIL